METNNDPFISEQDAIPDIKPITPEDKVRTAKNKNKKIKKEKVIENTRAMFKNVKAMMKELGQREESLRKQEVFLKDRQNLIDQYVNNVIRAPPATSYTIPQASPALVRQSGYHYDQSTETSSSHAQKVKKPSFIRF